MKKALLSEGTLASVPRHWSPLLSTGRIVLDTYRSLRLRGIGKERSWRVLASRFRMEIDPADFMDQAFYLGTYARALIELITRIVRPSDVCIDVGAQKGYVTLHLARAVGPTGLVVAVEPDPRASAILRSHCDRNSLTNTQVHECCLGDQAGQCDFTLSHQLGWSSRFPNDLAKPAIASTISVQTRRLDDIIEDTGIAPVTHRLSLIKIDAEGSEPLIIQGAQETLKRFRPAVHIEVNKSSLHAGGFSVHSIEALLRPLGYQFYAIRFQRTGWLQRRLSLIPVASVASDIGDGEDVLAVGSPSSL